LSPLEVPTRIPPHNLDAERAVLAPCSWKAARRCRASSRCCGRPISIPRAHRAIYQAMLTLFDRGAPVDSLTLSEELRRTDQLQFVGGPAAIALLMEEASIAAHLTSYTAIVRDMAVLRELIQTSTHIIGRPSTPRRTSRRSWTTPSAHLQPGRAAARGQRVPVKNILNGHLQVHRAPLRAPGARHRRADRPRQARRDDRRPAALRLILIAGRRVWARRPSRCRSRSTSGSSCT
jgi:hypothetical protein